jgi:AbiV family abortive infection protein
MKTEKAYLAGNKDVKIAGEKIWGLIGACWENVIDLIQDSEILFKKKRYSRAYALAYTALEELGKYLIVCDYYNGLVSKKEFEKAFFSHGIKPGYLFNKVEFSENSPLKIVYDEKKYESYFQLRNNSMYVGWDTKSEIVKKPIDHVDQSTAEYIINLVKDQVGSIRFAEELNGRIGSKALYK